MRTDIYNEYNLNMECLTAEKVGGLLQNRTCLTFYPDHSVQHIVREMQKYHQGAVNVIDGSGRLVGMVTERDILRKLFGFYGESQDAYDARQHNLGTITEDLTAWDVMVADPVCLRADMDIPQALEIIRKHGFRYMPVLYTKRGGKDCNLSELAGIVSERELFWQTQDKYRREMENKDTLLSYFMHHETYGAGGVSRGA